MVLRRLHFPMPDSALPCLWSTNQSQIESSPTHCCPTYSLSRGARGCSVYFVVTGIHVQCVIAVCINILFHDVTSVPINVMEQQ